MADRTVVYRLEAAVAGFQAGLAQASASTKKLANDLTSMDKSSVRTRQGLDTLGGAAGKFGLVAAAGLGAAVLASANFDASMSKVQAATNESAAAMNDLRQAALDAGADTVFSATEAADGVTALAKAGVATTDILSGGLTGALDLAAAGELDVAQAAEIAATTMTQFGLAGTDVAHIADVLAASAGKAQGEVTDMAGALKFVGPVAAQMGISLEETSGSIAYLASQGILGEQAGTSLRGMLTALTSPSKVAAEQMQALGINMYDASGAFIGLDGLAGQLQSSMEGLTEAERNEALGRIFGNEQITAARVLYAGGSDAITGWTAKVDDSGFAAEQAATKLDNLKGDLEALKGSLETAFIGTGDGAQGPLRSLTQGLTGAINAYNKLPQAAQSATAGIMTGAAVVGGSIWVGTKLINGLASAREAFAQVGLTSEKSGRLLKGLSAAAIGAGAGLTIAFTAGNKLVDAFREDLPGVQQLTGMLTDLSGGDIGALPDEFNSLADSIERINNPSFWKGQMTSDSVLGFFGQEGRTLAIATEEVEALDAALANMAATAGPDAAAGALKALGEAEEISAENMKLLSGMLPQYDEAMAGAANSAALLAGETEGSTSALDRNTQSLRDNIDAMREMRSAAIEAENAEIGYQASIDAARKSLKDNGRTLDITTDKGRANRQALLDQAAAWNNQSNAVKSSKGAHRDAIDTFVAVATQMGMNEQKARDYAKRLFEIPPNRKTKIELEAAAALNTMSQVERWLNILDGKRATTYIDTIRTGARTVPGLQMAGGGEVSGPGTATSDSIPIWGSDGEFMVKAAAVDKYGVDFFHRLNAMQLADGGLVRSPVSAGVSVGSPNVNVGGTSVQVFLDGREIDARVETRINTHARHQRQMEGR